MSSKIIEIVPEAGLHARPASEFVETAQSYDCDLEISDAEEDEEPVDARSMLAVTSLGLKQGDKIKIEAEGNDAEEALDALEEVVKTPEGE